MAAPALKVTKLIHHAVLFPPLKASKIVSFMVLFPKNTFFLPPRPFVIKPGRRK